MHTTTVIAGQPAQPLVVATNRPVTMNIPTTRGLGIAQLIIGSLTLILGISATASIGSYWANLSGGSIWGGIWIVISGILGVVSASHPLNGCLNGTHMAFCIISTIISFIDGIIFAISVAFYSNCRNLYYYGNSHDSYYYEPTRYYYTSYSYGWNCSLNADTGRGLFATLLVLMIAEFFIALAAAIFCCKASASCCSRPATQGVIIQQQQPQQFNVVTSSAGQQMMVPASTMQPVVYSGVPPQQYHYPHQQMQPMTTKSQMYPVGAQPMGMLPMAMQQPMMGGNSTNVSYSTGQKTNFPPSDNE